MIESVVSAIQYIPLSGATRRSDSLLTLASKEPTYPDIKNKDLQSGIAACHWNFSPRKKVVLGPKNFLVSRTIFSSKIGPTLKILFPSSRFQQSWFYLENLPPFIYVSLHVWHSYHQPFKLVSH